MIEASALCKRFGPPRGRWHGAAARSVQAVNGLGFVARDGAISGLLGANGAGKTTTLRMLAALIEPDAGRIAIDGIDAIREPRRALARIGVLSDARGLYPRLTARENIVYFGELQGMPREAAAARAEALGQWLSMQDLLERRAGGFSQGERMKTALARALVHDPHNLILDEPTNGLDVPSTRALREILRRLRAAGKCILFSSHVMQEVVQLCDHVVLVAAGRDVASGEVGALLARAGRSDFEDAFVELAYGS